MAELRLSEHYVSTQGEGPRTGQPTHFVRFAGCNMQCLGWPCDTPHAVKTEIYMAEGGSYKRTPEELLVDTIKHRDETGANNICLTGGEPFLQPNTKLEEYIDLLVHNGFIIEAFSNGSFIYSENVLKNVQFMMDWKLDGSGEGDTKLENRYDNALNLHTGSGIKFVCKDETDFNQAIETYELLKDKVKPGVRFWAGSAWAVFPERDVVDLILKNKLPWSLNVQVHNFVWPVNERGR
jgi:organic radical activating enzyme